MNNLLKANIDFTQKRSNVFCVNVDSSFKEDEELLLLKQTKRQK